MTEEFQLTPDRLAWPLLFRFRGPVLGKGYIAVVELLGRVIARPEDNDSVWLDGVNPGALAVGASSIKSANKELNSALTAVFVDFAEQADGFDDFKTAVVKFFHETDDESVSEWEASVAAVQRGALTSPGILPVLSAQSPLTVDVTYKSIESVTPQDNPEPEPVLATVA
jgi:hypothetical protein